MRVGKAADRRARFHVLVCLCLWSLLSTLIWHRYVFGFYLIEGPSMAPTLGSGDMVLVNLMGGHFGSLDRGDIVLVQDGFEETATKRVVGLPGERVEIKGGYVHLNGCLYREQYLPRYVATLSQQKYFQLGTNEFFVLGDNRYDSYDSRDYGPVRRAAIIGRVVNTSL